MKEQFTETFEFEVTDNGSDVVFINQSASKDFFVEDKNLHTAPLPGNDKREYVLWGSDNRLPFNLIELIEKDEVMSANKHFNVLTCYGSGIRFEPCDPNQKPQQEVDDFVRRNSFPRLFLELATDMKYFYWCVAVIVLNKKGDKIVNIRPQEACYCRFEKADADGKIKHVFFADFNTSAFGADEYDTVTLLDEYDPLGELNVLLGREPGPDGQKKERTKERKFAIVCKFPTPANRYYPIPYYAALFRGSWFDIKQLIGIGKKTKIKNHSGIRYLVNINAKYWEELFAKEKITDTAKQKERAKKEREDINKFLSGVENSGKTLYSGYYIDPNGVEVQMIKIQVIDTSKEGGDWSEDIQEASNMLCYADNIHPNLVGATPGKGQQNNSGSDKRELFTLKQSLEIAYHDIMKLPFDVVAGFNQWNVKPVVPMITLTTLDTHRDAEQVTAE